jgi:hypothetical protein
MKALLLVVAVFGLLACEPALSSGFAQDRERAIFSLAFMLLFVAAGVTFSVAINDSYVELLDDRLQVRFEAFFHLEIPLEDIVSVQRIDPASAWRFRFGLSTDWAGRVCCSHGGPLLELQLHRAAKVRLWPRTVRIERLWLGVQEQEALINAIQRRLIESNHMLATAA